MLRKRISQKNEEDFVKTLGANESHRYLDNKLSIYPSERRSTAIKSCKRDAWMTFGKHINKLLYRNISAYDLFFFLELVNF